LGGFLGGTNIYQKLQAQKAAGQAVDLLFHDGLSARLLKLYDLTRDVTPQVKQQIAKYGNTYTNAQADLFLDNKWWGMPFHGRTGGYWYRMDRFANAGFTREAGSFDTWENVLQATRATTDPDHNFYTWGMTVDRSGDGESLTWDIIHSWGGALADESGQVVTLFSPETIDAMTWLSDIYLNPANAPMLPPGVNAWDDFGNNTAWLAGQIGFSSNAGTMYATSVANKTTLPEDPNTLLSEVTGLMPLPLGPFGIRLQGSGGMQFYFMNGGKNFDAAAQLADFLLGGDVQPKLWQISSGYAIPSYENLWNDPIIVNNRIAQGFKPVHFNPNPSTGVAYRGPFSEAADAVSQQSIATDMIGEILAGKPVIQAVRDNHLRCVEIFQSFGLKGR
jgi:multiple sugar transport system substrate-binding protein